MTNEEAINKLEGKKELLDNNGFVNLDEFDIAINSIQENTKLKAEIEQLKENYDTLAKQYSNVENSSIQYYNELKKLKSELEQSIREKSEVISKIEYALNECEPIYNKCAVIPQAKPIYNLAMNYCLDLLKGQV